MSIVIAQAAVFILPIIATVIAGWRRAKTGETMAIVRSHRKFKRHAYAAVAFSLLRGMRGISSSTYGVAATKQEIKLVEPEKYSLVDGVSAY